MNYLISLIGEGNLGVSLAHSMNLAGLQFNWFKRSEFKRSFSQRDEQSVETIYLCAVNEPSLKPLVSEFKGTNKKSIYIHFSGSVGFDVFPEHIRKRSAILHPMQTFPNRTTPINLSECTFTFQGAENLRIEMSDFVASLSLNVIPLNLKSAEAYHLLGVVSSNLMVALVSICMRLGQENDLSEKEVKSLILPLMNQTLHNVEKFNLYDALSGPLKRGATNVIEKHEAFLENFQESYASIYRLLNQELTEQILNPKKK